MRFEFYKDMAHEWRWRMRASNGKIVAEGGEGYKKLSSMDRTLRKIFSGRTYGTELDKALVAANKQAMTLYRAQRIVNEGPDAFWVFLGVDEFGWTSVVKTEYAIQLPEQQMKNLADLAYSQDDSDESSWDIVAV